MPIPPIQNTRTRARSHTPPPLTHARCADAPPPFPALPPFGPLPANGLIVRLPRLDLSFDLQPLNTSVGHASRNFSAAVSAIACAHHPWCAAASS